MLTLLAEELRLGTVVSEFRDLELAHDYLAYLELRNPSREERKSPAFEQLTQAHSKVWLATTTPSPRSQELFDYLVANADDEYLCTIGEGPVQDWANSQLEHIAPWLATRAQESERWRAVLACVDIYPDNRQSVGARVLLPFVLA